VKLRWRTDHLNARTRPHAQTSGLPTLTDAQHTPTCSFFARQPTTEPGWPATSSDSQQPQQQFCTASVASPAKSLATSAFSTSSTIRMFDPRHQRWVRLAYVSDTSSKTRHQLESWSGAPQTLIHLTRGFICIVH
jgi:hypothetical protein